MSIQVSRDIRLQIESALAGSFNGRLASACTEFGIAGQAFEIDFDAPGRNYYLADFDLDAIKQISANQWPSVTFNTPRCVDEHQQVGATFEGPVSIKLAFFYRFTDPTTADMQSLPEAVESVVLTLLYGIDTLRQGSVTIEKDPPEFDKDGWYVVQTFEADYEVTV